MAKMRKVDPRRNLRSLHPYEIWLEIHRHRVFSKLSDAGDEGIAANDIAARIFSNWEDLNFVDKEHVIECKLIKPLNLMRRLRIVTRDVSRGGMIMDRWKIEEESDFHKIYGMERYLEVMQMSLDDSWADYTGRTARHLRILEKYT